MASRLNVQECVRECGTFNFGRPTYRTDTYDARYSGHDEFGEAQILAFS